MFWHNKNRYDVIPPAGMTYEIQMLTESQHSCFIYTLKVSSWKTLYSFFIIFLCQRVKSLNACISKQEIYSFKKFSKIKKWLKLLANVHGNAYWLWLHRVISFFSIKLKTCVLGHFYWTKLAIGAMSHKTYFLWN